MCPRNLRPKKTQKPDELPKIERNTRHGQVYGVVDLAFGLIAQHSRTIFKVGRGDPLFADRKQGLLNLPFASLGCL